jgi:hypothetical protein
MEKIQRTVSIPIFASTLATVTLRRAVTTLSLFSIPIGCCLPRIASIVVIFSNLSDVTNVVIATMRMGAPTVLFAIHVMIVRILSIASDVRIVSVALAFVTRNFASSMSK